MIHDFISQKNITFLILELAAKLLEISLRENVFMVVFKESTYIVAADDVIYYSNAEKHRVHKHENVTPSSPVQILDANKNFNFTLIQIGATHLLWQLPRA